MAFATAVDLFGRLAPIRREPRVAIVVERRYLAQRQPARLMAALTTAGLRVALLDPSDAGDAEALDVDLLVARGRAPGLLALLEAAESRGIPTVNRRAAITAVLDRAALARSLRVAGIPTPPTRVGTPAAITESTPASGFLEVKLYAIGRDVYAARPTGHGEPRLRAAEITPAQRALALRCGALFALELFGVDCVEMPGGPVVVAVSDFPDYPAIDGADERLARYVIARARRGGRGGGAG